MNALKITAIIPARGGSKGLPKKNILNLAGKPMIEYTILAARGCALIKRVIVSTEDKAIAAAARAAGAEVFIRPARLATDGASMQSVVRSVLHELRAQNDPPDYLVLLQPTSPLRNGRHLTDCLTDFLSSHAASAVSVTEVEYHPYKSLLIKNGKLVPVYDEASLSQSRQKLPKAMRQNGAIYIISRQLFLKRNSFFVEPVFPFIMTHEESVDIDTRADFDVCERYLKMRGAMGRKVGKRWGRGK